jgi:late competence protein required for DNA uptake (superfamily II DNA/RNA helicase)
MLKILLLVVILIAIYFIFFKKKRKVESKEPYRDRRDDQIVNDLIPCEHCGTLTPQSEAIISNGTYYCSDSCIVQSGKSR